MDDGNNVAVDDIPPWFQNFMTTQTYENQLMKFMPIVVGQFDSTMKESSVQGLK